MSAERSARQLAADALMRWDQGTRYADEILGDVTRGRKLTPQDRALVQLLFYGVIRHLSKLDSLIAELRDGKIDRESLQLLRLGMEQIFHTEIPDHAAVSETVALSRKKSRGFINGILRNATRKREELEAMAADWPLDLRESHPDFLIDRWNEQFGEESTEALCVHNNQPSSVFVRVNTLVPEAAEAIAAAENTIELGDEFPGFYKIDGPIPVEWIQKGWVYMQDPATNLSCRLVDPQPGETILDACAAPGGKSTLMAAMMKNEGALHVADSVPSRIERLRDNLNRLRVTNATIHQLDWAKPLEEELGQFDAILLDVPCSNSGVMQRRVDVRWRLDPGEFDRMPKTQLEIVEAVLPLLKPGGRLIYSTCSIERVENEDVVKTILEQHPELVAEETLRSLPWESGYDGAFAARLRLPS